MPVESPSDLASFFDIDEFGRLASWGGVFVPIILTTHDRDAQVGSFGAVLESNMTVQVQQSVLPNPAKGDQIIMDDDGSTYRVIAVPKMNMAGLWDVEVSAQ